MLSSTTGTCRWILLALAVIAFLGLAIAGTIVLSLISLYVPNKSKSPVCQISFRPMVSYPTDLGPSAVKAADVNKDGHVDLVVTNYDANTTNVFFGKGDGTFPTRLNLSTNAGFNPIMLAIADVNNDNNLDIIVSYIESASVGVFLGQGNGAFGQAILSSTGTGSTPLGLGIGDFNKDGFQDLAVASNGDSRLVIMIGIGNGSFTNTRSYTTGNRSRSYLVVVNDFNKDNNLDVIVANGRANNIGVFLGDGRGNFAEQKTYTVAGLPFAIVAADINKDGNLDIVSADYGSNTTTVTFGVGDGSFAQQLSYSTGNSSTPNAVLVADFNRDNIQDIIVVNGETANFGILLGSGNGLFQSQQTFSTGSASNPVEFTVGDFNRDNRLDVATINYNNNTMGVFISTCSTS